jgi:K(+)-stimulated pyrophosphate-energized sodium pump
MLQPFWRWFLGYMIQDMGGNIQDAFGGIGYFTNGNCRFWNFISIIGTMVVKITDDNAKEAQVKSIK